LQLLQAVPYDAKHLMMQRMKRRHFRFFMGKDLQMLQVVLYDVKHLMGQHVKPLMTYDRTVRVHVIKKMLNTRNLLTKHPLHNHVRKSSNTAGQPFYRIAPTAIKHL